MDQDDALLGLPGTFLRWKFEGQHSHYQQHDPDCELLVIERWTGDDRDGVGRRYVNRWADEIRRVDVALLLEHRGGEPRTPPSTASPSISRPRPGEPQGPGRAPSPEP